MTQIQQNPPQALISNPDFIRFRDDDALIVSMPDKYCYLYAIADYLNLIDYDGLVPDIHDLTTAFIKYMNDLKCDDHDPIVKHILISWFLGLKIGPITIEDKVLGLELYKGPQDTYTSRYLIELNPDGSHHVYVNLNGTKRPPTYKVYNCVGRRRNRGAARAARNARPPQRRRRPNNNQNNQNRNSNAAANPPAVRTQVRRSNPRSRLVQAMGQAGEFVGGMYGMAPLGRMGGQRLGQMINTIRGSGDYVLGGAPTYNTLATNGPPSFGNIGGVTRVRHREYLFDVNSTTAFTILNLPLQPCNTGTFPWLSTIAMKYEQYRFHGLVFEFKSTSANALNSINTALGQIGMVTQYDPNNPPFPNKQSAENYMGSQSCSPSTSMLHAVECARNSNILNRLYTRAPDDTSNTDKDMTDWGIFSLFTSGSQASSVVGELWVSYEVEFFKPKQASTLTFGDYHSSVNVGPGILWPVVNTTPQLNQLGSYMRSNTIYFPSTMQRGRYLILVEGVRTLVGTEGASHINLSASSGPLVQVLKSNNHAFGWIGSTSISGNDRVFHTAMIDILESGAATYTLTPVFNTGSTWALDYTLLMVPSSSVFNTSPTSTSLTLDEINLARALLTKFGVVKEEFEEDKHESLEFIDPSPPPKTRKKQIL